MRSVLLTASVFVFLGCQATRPIHRAPALDSTPVVSAFEERDVTVLGAAERIDTTVESTPYETPVKTETDTIRRAVEKTSASNVAELAKSFTVITEQMQKQIDRLEKQLDEERNRAMRAQSDKLNWAGLGFLALFGLSFFAGPAAALKTWPLAVLGGGCLALSQIVSSPWFARGGAILIGVALIYFIWWVYDRHKQGRLEAALQKRVALFKKIVPVIDNASDEARSALKSAFKEVMSDDDKAEIHAIKAEITSGVPRI